MRPGCSGFGDPDRVRGVHALLPVPLHLPDERLLRNVRASAARFLHICECSILVSAHASDDSIYIVYGFDQILSFDFDFSSPMSSELSWEQCSWCCTLTTAGNGRAANRLHRCSPDQNRIDQSAGCAGAGIQEEKE